MNTLLPGAATIQRTYDSDTGRLTQVTLPGTYGNIQYGCRSSYGYVSQLSGPSNVVLTIVKDGPLPVQWQWSGDVAGTVAWTHNADFLVSTETVGTSSVAYSYVRDDLKYNDSLPTRVGAYTLTNGLITSSGVGLTLGWEAERPILTSTQLKDEAAATRAIDIAYVPNAYGELSMLTASTTTPAQTLLEVDYEPTAQTARDAKGRIIRKVETIVVPTESALPAWTTYDYQYDAQGRLWKVWLNDAPEPVYTYAYDDNGNRLNDGTMGADATYDNQDRLITYGADLSFEYTAQGSLSKKTDGDLVTTYGYDALGNLRSVQMPNKQITYVVDGMGRRVGKKVGEDVEFTLIYRSQLQPVVEVAASTTTRFVYSGSRNVPDYAIRDGEAYQLVTDHLGSLRLVVKLSDGAIMQRMDYGPFGEVVADWVATPEWRRLPFGFAGGIYDRDTGLVRFGARDYDAAVGRWTTKDPIGFAGGDANLYGYMAGDPANGTDPEGQMVLVAPCLAAVAFCAGYSGGATGAQLLENLETCRELSDQAKHTADACDPLQSREVGKAKAEAYWQCVLNVPSVNFWNISMGICWVAAASICATWG